MLDLYVVVHIWLFYSERDNNMNWRKKLDILKDRAEMLIYDEDMSEIDLINRKIMLYSEKIFGNKDKYGNEAINISHSLCTYSEVEQHEAWEQWQKKLVNLITTMIEEYQLSQNEERKENTMVDNKKIFIVHGHNENLKLEVGNWLYGLGLTPIILHQQANGGTKSIIDKLEKNSDVRCAIVLMTADDEGKEKNEDTYKDRARQNVVFEAGYFIGKLKPENVILLYETGVDIPSDLGGCIYIEADKKGGWKELVRTEFNAMGIDYDK